MNERVLIRFESDHPHGFKPPSQLTKVTKKTTKWSNLDLVAMIIKVNYEKRILTPST